MLIKDITIKNKAHQAVLLDGLSYFISNYNYLD